VYSLGSVLYEMLTGNPPHLGASAQQIIMKIVTEEAAPVTRFRKSVPPHVAAAVAMSLEKLPADRFDSARAFAEALGNPGFATTRHAAAVAAAADSSWLRDRRTVATLAVAAVALASAAWLAGRPDAGQGPREYDVGLPDSAELWTIRGAGFAVAPGGDFVVYQALREGRGELWYRSLLDGSARRIDGTEDGWQPTLSRDGSRLAFFRERAGSWTVEVMPVNGGPATTLGSGTSAAEVQWLADGRVMVVEADGKRIRRFDPGGGPSTAGALAYCIMPSQLPDPDQLLCGGGGDYRIHRIGIGDSVKATYLWTGAGADSAPVFGSNPRVVAGKYLVYVSLGGDLQAAPVDLGTGRVGRSVRLATGLGRREYSGAGSYDISAAGTLVYAYGVDHAVGHLVQADERGVDTLPVGREAFLRIAFSPDRRRLAAVIEGREGQELRIYDLRTGRYVPWVRRAEIRQPVWNPRGDRLLFSDANAVFVGAPDRAGAPETVYTTPHRFEGWAWLPDDRVSGTLMRLGVAVMLDLGARPTVLDTLLPDASFTRLSPDGRWIAYNDRSITSLWLEPFPRDGRRYQLAANRAGEPQWRSPTELVVQTTDLVQGIDRLSLNTSTDPPEVVRRPWLRLPGFLETAGQSATLSPDGRMVFAQGAGETPVPWLRVIPGWVDQMRRSVDQANR
jgi:serine/threonine-protein kinase